MDFARRVKADPKMVVVYSMALERERKEKNIKCIK
jgi:hypothetical protein